MAAPEPIDCLSVGILVADHVCNILPRLPAPGELVLTPRLQLALGGCAANVAFALSRLGFKAAVVGCVGADPSGQFLLGTLAANGVDVSGIRRVHGADTSASLVLNVAEEDRRFIHSVGANANLTAGDVALDQVRSARVLYVGGYLLLPGLEAKSLTELFRRARSAGVKTVLDVVLAGTSGHWQQLETVLSETDVFLPNQDEAKATTGLDDPIAQAEQLAAAGVGTVVVTCGAAGSVVVSTGARLRVGVYPSELVGGTGAGDAFDAGFIAGMLEGENLEGCLRWGSAMGASCVRSTSATESLFKRDELNACLRAYTLSIERI